jgi:hypothetical protein
MLQELQPDGSAVLQNGQAVHGIDATVYCTGYKYSFPWLEHLGLLQTGAAMPCQSMALDMHASQHSAEQCSRVAQAWPEHHSSMSGRVCTPAQPDPCALGALLESCCLIQCTRWPCLAQTSRESAGAWGLDRWYPILLQNRFSCPFAPADNACVRPLFAHMFIPSVGASLALCGLPWRSAKFPQFQLQGQLLARLLSGRAVLPPQQVMEQVRQLLRR